MGDESRVKNENYIHIAGWMVNDLKLKGNELLVYAIIYGFSQDGETHFTGSLKYLADWTNSTKRGVMKNLQSLTEKGYIKKVDRFINGVKFCEYYATKFYTLVNNVTYPSEHSSIGGSEHSSTNNIDINNIAYNIEKKKSRAHFVEPTLEEVKAYCEERNNGIDAQHFIDYYSARGWELSKGRKIRDWKACVRTWENNSYNRKPTKQAEKPQQKPKEINVDDFRRADGTIDCDAYMRAQYS